MAPTGSRSPRETPVSGSVSLASGPLARSSGSFEEERGKQVVLGGPGHEQCGAAGTGSGSGEGGPTPLGPAACGGGAGRLTPGPAAPDAQPAGG